MACERGVPVLLMRISLVLPRRRASWCSWSRVLLGVGGGDPWWAYGGGGGGGGRGGGGWGRDVGATRGKGA